MLFRFSGQFTGKDKQVIYRLTCRRRLMGRVLTLCALTAMVVCSVGRDAVRAQTQPLALPYDTAGRTGVVLAHLDAALRFYRDSEAPIQKAGEPSDLYYRDQAVAQATDIAGLAFQSAKAEAALIDRSSPHEETGGAGGSQSQRLQKALDQVKQRIAALNAEDATLASEIATASPKKREQLQQQREDVNGELELQTAMADAVHRFASMAETSSGAGFTAQVNQLEQSAPGITSKKATTVAPTLESLSEVRSSGVSTQARVVYELLSARESIDKLTEESNRLHDQVTSLRVPLINALKHTIAEGQALSENSAAAAMPAGKESKASPKGPKGPDAAAQMSSTQKTFKELTSTFNELSGAAVPLSQEILLIGETQANLQAWRTAVNEEYDSILRSLLLRVLFIAVALAAIFVMGDVWRRTTKRYVRDVRRRRQLLVVRRLLTGFLSGLVLIFGLVTQFSSLATFAGLITAGIAVGLQTILLSVAAYFFIIGRYGIKVGDRITIAGTTGDVVEVGLVRFYMMEMAGSGTDLYSTGRMAVFSNAVLFQAGTPLYKQMPGTEYAWHELTLRFSPDADYRTVVEEMLKSIQNVYEDYRPQLERQHKHLETWMDSSLDTPRIQSYLQLVDGGLQFWVRFPVIIREAAVIDEKMTEALLQLISSDQRVKDAVSAPPVIKAAVRG